LAPLSWCCYLRLHDAREEFIFINKFSAPCNSK
jgi:hypothetical protein